MRTLMVLVTIFWAGVLLLAARAMATAQSPPAAYAAALVGAGAVGALGVSLLIIWLVAA